MGTEQINAELTDAEHTNTEHTDNEPTNAEHTDTEQTDTELTDAELTDTEQINAEHTDTEQNHTAQANTEQADAASSPAPDSRAITAASFFGLTHYEYGEAYFGSYQGMRYRLAAVPLENIHFKPKDKWGDVQLLATVWPEPLSYAATPAEARTSETFPFSEEGLEAAADWLNARYEADRERYQEALRG